MDDKHLLIRDAVNGHQWADAPHVNLGASGPTRTADKPDEKFVPREVGFMAKLKPTEVEPLLGEYTD